MTATTTDRRPNSKGTDFLSHWSLLLFIAQNQDVWCPRMFLKGPRFDGNCIRQSVYDYKAKYTGCCDNCQTAGLSLITNIELLYILEMWECQFHPLVEEASHLCRGCITSLDRPCEWTSPGFAHRREPKPALTGSLVHQECMWAFRPALTKWTAQTKTGPFKLDQTAVAWEERLRTLCHIY